MKKNKSSKNLQISEKKETKTIPFKDDYNKLTPKNKLNSGLYIIATPIGNLGDMSIRAIQTLKSVDIIACEDTRRSLKLLDHYKIKKNLIPYHDHNGSKVRPKILRSLISGKSIALISDAGTPLISDPGYKLITEARLAKIPIFPIPGPSALTAALSIAGIPANTFIFLGFLPTKKLSRLEIIKKYKDLDTSLVIYETSLRIKKLIKELLDILGPRNTAICREMTKIYEEVIYENLDSLEKTLSNKKIKGEIVVLVGPPSNKRIIDDNQVKKALMEELKKLNPSQASVKIANITGNSRNKLYRMAIEIKKEMILK